MTIGQLEKAVLQDFRSQLKRGIPSDPTDLIARTIVCHAPKDAAALLKLANENPWIALERPRYGLRPDKEYATEPYIFVLQAALDNILEEVLNKDYQALVANIMSKEAEEMTRPRKRRSGMAPEMAETTHGPVDEPVGPDVLSEVANTPVEPAGEVNGVMSYELNGHLAQEVPA